MQTACPKGAGGLAYGEWVRALDDDAGLLFLDHDALLGHHALFLSLELDRVVLPRDRAGVLEVTVRVQ